MDWTLKDAEARFSDVAEAARNGEPQRVAADGGDVVVVAAQKFDLMTKRPKTFVEHLLDFPKLPDDCQDLFDDRHEYESTPRDVDFGS